MFPAQNRWRNGAEVKRESTATPRDKKRNIYIYIYHKAKKSDQNEILKFDH